MIALSAIILMLAATGINGRIAFQDSIHSDSLQTNRMVRVFVPPGYDDNPQKRFPVLYVHDGQNAFSSAGPGVAFGWGNWQLDITAAKLIAERKMRPVVIVAVDCGASRYREYRGPAPANVDGSAWNRYTRFLLTELKPRIDREYRTIPGPESTGLLGSSMGGIASVALAWEHPEIFGLAASLSGAFQIEKKYFLTSVLTKYKGDPKPIRLYLDSGTVDYTGGDDGAKDTEAVVRQFEHIGWVQGSNLLHFVDRVLTAGELTPLDLTPGKFEEAQRSQHNELYWRLRVWRALTFLFPPDQ